MREKYKSDPQELEKLGIKKEGGRDVLLALNMRNNFGISPIAIVHNDGDQDVLEIPERTSTILSPGDQLVFLMPDSAQGTAQGITKCMYTLNQGELKIEELPLGQGAAVHKVVKVLPVTPRKRKRRGGGREEGEKKRARKE